MTSSDERHPCWPIPLDQWKGEHIYDSSVEPCAIALSEGDDVCYLRVRGVVEDEAIEDAVDDITCCSCHDECQTDEVPPFHPFPDLPCNVYAYKECGQETETGQEDFIEKLHAEGHSVVLDKGDIKPISDAYALVYGHVGLHPDLDQLVYDESAEEDGTYGESLTGFLFHVGWGYLPTESADAFRGAIEWVGRRSKEAIGKCVP